MKGSADSPMTTLKDIFRLRMSRLTRGQAECLLAQVVDGVATPRCPECLGLCSVIRTTPWDGVPYVRRRIVVRCSRCLANCSLELKDNRESLGAESDAEEDDLRMERERRLRR